MNTDELLKRLIEIHGEYCHSGYTNDMCGCAIAALICDVMESENNATASDPPGFDKFVAELERRVHIEIKGVNLVAQHIQEAKQRAIDSMLQWEGTQNPNVEPKGNDDATR